MDKLLVENIVSDNLKPIFGFALKRCRSIEDAEDLTQEIAVRAFHALMKKEEIADVGKFIWTIAHNALSNYYRRAVGKSSWISVEGAAEQVADPNFVIDEMAEREEETERLRREIAYLSRLQRKIVIEYYFRNRKQAEIAEMLGIPPGTVKWHLFEAKKELKRGMDTMRNVSELKFDPIRFHSYGVNGSIGTKSPDEFFRSALSQNICYCVRNEAKSVNEIADALGVSPVYVESEAEFLEEYGFLQEKKGKYIINFIISEPTAELLVLQNAMYKQAAELFANDLYDELTSSGILRHPDIRCGQREEGSVAQDQNFVLWTLIPYIAACSGEENRKQTISFEDVATIRPDGGYNIYHASVVPEEMQLPEDYVYMKNWRGPIWNGEEERVLWRVDSEWSAPDRTYGLAYAEERKRVLALYGQAKQSALSEEDCAWLAERGYISMKEDSKDHFTAEWQIVGLASKEIREQLLAVGERIKQKHRAEFDALKAPYVEASLRAVPAHLKRVREYELQYVFHSDGWFLVHCIVALLKNGKLKEPKKEQRKALSILIAEA